MHWTATEKSTTPSSLSALQGISVMRGAVAVSTCAVAVPCPLWSEVMLLLLPAMKLAPKKSSTTPVVAEHAVVGTGACLRQRPIRGVHRYVVAWPGDKPRHGSCLWLLGMQGTPLQKQRVQPRTG